MFAGYAQSVITPDFTRPVYLAGFDNNTVAQSVHDALYCRVLTLTHATTTLVLVTLDVIGLNRYRVLALETALQQKTGRADLSLVIACSHTHHAPDTIGLWGPDLTTSGVDDDYMAWLHTTVVDTAAAALADMGRTVLLRAVSVEVKGVAKNARDPHILDQEATCLQWYAPDHGKVFATLVIYPCHPEVLWRGHTAITSDYVDRLRTKLESLTDAPVLFMAGALGGMMTPDMGANTHEAADKMGEIIANAAHQALFPLPHTPVQRLNVERREVKLPMHNILFEQAIQAGLLKELRGADGLLTSEVSLIKFDSCWLAAIPGELLPKLGKELKHAMKAAGATVAGVIGLANDEIGYILPQDEFIYPENPFEPDDHYEETMSLGAETAPRLMNVLRALF